MPKFTVTLVYQYVQEIEAKSYPTAQRIANSLRRPETLEDFEQCDSFYRLVEEV